MSQMPCCGRLTPRWSVAGHPVFVPALIAGPPVSACVSVGPPLLPSAPRCGSPILSPARREAALARRRGRDVVALGREHGSAVVGGSSRGVVGDDRVLERHRRVVAPSPSMPPPAWPPPGPERVAVDRVVDERGRPVLYVDATSEAFTRVEAGTRRAAAGRARDRVVDQGHGVGARNAFDVNRTAEPIAAVRPHAAGSAGPLAGERVAGDRGAGTGRDADEQAAAEAGTAVATAAARAAGAIAGEHIVLQRERHS